MGLCGSAQICRSNKNDLSESNMHKKKSLSSPKDVGFAHDKQQNILQDTDDTNKIMTSPSSSPTLSGVRLLNSPNNDASRRTQSNISRRGLQIDTSNPVDRDTPKSIQPVPNKPEPLHSRQSRQVSDESAQSTTDKITMQPNISSFIGSRVSTKYIALNDEEITEHELNANDNATKQTSASTETNTTANSNTVTTETPTPSSCKANTAIGGANDNTLDNNDNSNTRFVRERQCSRDRENSRELAREIEERLMEDSNTHQIEEYGGLVTPIATSTPSNNLRVVAMPDTKELKHIQSQHGNKCNRVPQKDESKQTAARSKHDSNDVDVPDDDELGSPNNAYPLDFEDTSNRSNGAGAHKQASITPAHTKSNSLDSSVAAYNKRHRELGNRRNAGTQSLQPGPMSAFTTTSQSSQSSMTVTVPHFASNDNININDIYVATRQPNLSLSAIAPIISMPTNNATPINSGFPRCSSTSSDFQYYLEHGYHRDSKTREDSSDNIMWGRMSHGSIGNTNPQILGGSMSNIAIERTDKSQSAAEFEFD
eukprot:CAMPEP_0197028258 /NCGR_PEP_ID=MMETSP1384-20130603/7983_1 /TAXON_ID=29189 /ORGANISM="Ammonia sp." /LENGTH=538 /DNA_ID=CAMNT_0042457229 /DNA_START=40 /DNA_END=1656 /DNA_ORIENTATION=+